MRSDEQLLGANRISMSQPLDKYLYKEVPCHNHYCIDGYVEQIVGDPWECERVICEVCNGETVVEVVDDNEPID